jgi:hypothetical protein
MMKTMKYLTMAAAAITLCTGAPAMAQTAEEIEAARNEIWAMELSIYAGREQGDMSNYRNNVAEGYMAWPPVTAAPMRASNLGRDGDRGSDQELIRLTFQDFSMNGDTAVIYYKSHRTRRADGTPSDDHFDVTHTWLKRDGRWGVFAGMARTTPQN